MKANRTTLTVVVILVLILAGWWLFRRENAANTIDLVAQFESAKKQPNAGVFEVTEATLKDETKRAIAVTPSAGTRLTWKITVPDDGWLWVWVGLKPEAWDKAGDGVKFHVGVSDGRAYEQLFTQHVDPFNTPSDRRWTPVKIDLSAYAGEQVDLIFNTNSSEPGKGNNTSNDLALWGSPEIVVR
jgi:hypothetical protein